MAVLKKPIMLDETGKLIEAAIKAQTEALKDMKSDYTLPVATTAALGGVKAAQATESDTVPVHIKTDGTLAVPTYPSGGGGGAAISDICFADSYVDKTSADITTALQALIDKVWKAGGGTIIFGRGIYKFKCVNMRSRVSLQGQGIGGTVLQRIDGGTLKGFLWFPVYHTGGHIKDLTISGYDMTALLDGKMGCTYFPKGYFTPGAMCGMYYETGHVYTETIGGSTKKKSAGCLASGHIFTEADNICYKFAYISNILVIGFPGYGIYIPDSIYAFFIHDGSIECNGAGMYIASSDSVMSDMIIEGNAYEGLLCLAGNSKISNLKIIWNGQWTTVANRKSPFAAVDFNFLEGQSACWAAQLYCSRSSITNVEAQDNYCNGIYIGGNDVSATGVICDSNGMVCANQDNNWGKDYDPTNNYEYMHKPQDCVGILIKGQRQYVQCKTTNYMYTRSPARKQPMLNSLALDWCKNSEIHWTDSVVGNDGNAAREGGGTSELSVTPLYTSNVTETVLNGVNLAPSTT